MPVRITFADIRAHSAAWQGACLPGRGFCRPTDSAIRLASANRPGFEKPPAGSCSMDVFARSAQDRPSMATVRFCRANKTLSTVFVSIIAQRFPLFNSFCVNIGNFWRRRLQTVILPAVSPMPCPLHADIKRKKASVRNTEKCGQTKKQAGHVKHRAKRKMQGRTATLRRANRQWQARAKGRKKKTNKNRQASCDICRFLVGEGGFGPPKSVTTDLQSAPFGRSGNPPYGAGERSRTINLLITNQLLCH